MANHKSAAKRARQSIKRAARNLAHKTRVKGSIRAFREALKSGEPQTATLALQTACKLTAQAASKGVLHKRNAARRISRLTIACNNQLKST